MTISFIKKTYYYDFTATKEKYPLKYCARLNQKKKKTAPNPWNGLLCLDIDG